MPRTKTATEAPLIRLRMRVTHGETIAIGPGKIALLEAVQAHGSITSAAKSLGMSYRRAWVLVDELNRSLQTPAVASEQGGPRGGGSVLTPAGEKVLRLYRAIEAKALKACAADMAKLLAMVPGR
jgi:molybdate transport system regulatory protein